MEVSLKAILFFATLFLIISFCSLGVKRKEWVDMIRIMQCVFFGAIICMSMTGLDIAGF